MNSLFLPAPNSAAPASKRWPAWAHYALIATTLIALMVGLIAVEAWQEKLRYRERATVATRNIAALLDSRISDVADKVDVVLRDVGNHYEEQAEQGRLTATWLNRQLQRHEALLPEVSNLRVLDKDGFARYGGGLPAGNPVSLSDREFYSRARDDPASRLIVFGPIFGRISQQWVLVFARRLNAPDGSFAGVVYANLATAYFDKILSPLTLGKYGAATLRMTDLSLVHRYPDTHGQVGSREVSPELREMVQAHPERGDYLASTALDGIERSNAYRKLERYPFYVIVGLATEDYLGGWHDNVFMLSGLAGLAILLTGFAAMLVYRTNRRLLTDIEQRKLIAAELEQHRDHLEELVSTRTKELERAVENTRLFVKMAPICIAMFDREMNYLSTSDLWLTEIVRGRRQLLGRNCYEINPDLPQTWKQAHQQGLGGRATRNDADPWCPADGSRRWLYWAVAPWRHPNGQIDGVIIFAEDITRRKQVEQALRASEEQFRAFFNTQALGTAMVLLDGNFLRVNQTLCEMTGYREDELLAMGPAKLTHPDDRPQLDALLTFLGGKGLSYKSERRYIRKDGEVIWIQVNAALVRDEHGKVLYAAETIQEITARKLHEARIADAMVKVELANKAKSRFLAAASHDLRQPLSALSIYINVLADKVAPAEQQFVANMKECVAGLSNLLNDLLDLSKLSAGVVKVNVDDFPIADLLDSLQSVYSPVAESRGLRLRSVPSKLIVRTDQVLLHRILSNFIDNALRYTNRGGVVVGCRRREGRVFVEVWDSGVGIPADKRSEIFEEFRQLGDEARNSGSGLGLAIAAKTADLLGLEIQLRSQVGCGSVFAIEIALGHADTLPAPPVRVTARRALRIALVEDNRLVRDALTAAMQESGHQVVSTASGDMMLTALGTQPPDIVVSDYRLAHGLTGYEAISVLRARFGTALPAIIISGDTDPLLLRRMNDRGIVVLHKPLDLEELQAYLEDLSYPANATSS